MLPIEMKVGDVLTVGNDVEIMVVSASEGTVQLDIVAPRCAGIINRGKEPRRAETETGDCTDDFIDLVRRT